MTRPIRLAIVFSHPVPYFVPLFRALAREPDLDPVLLYAAEVGIRPVMDPGFGVPVAWATPLTDGYEHVFLPGAGGIDRLTFWGVNNAGVEAALAKAQPDAVIIHGYAMVTMLRALAWCRLHGIPALMLADSSADRVPPGLRRWIKYRVIPVLLNQFAGLLTWGERSESYFAGFGYPRHRLHRVPTMLDAAFWAARAARAEHRATLRAANDIEPDDFVVLASGKLIARKRIDDIIAAIARPDVVGSGRRTVLLVAGDGVERAALERLAVEKGIAARFLGFVNIDVLPAVYAAADVFAHAAEFEPFGVVLTEAAALGLPLVVSDEVGGVGATAVARPDVNTLVFPCRDCAALAGALVRLRDDRTLRERLADASDTISRDHRGDFSVAAVKAAVWQSIGKEAQRAP